jgi:hypothetical protein
MEILLDQQEIKKPDGIKWRDRLSGLKKKYLQSLPRSGLVLPVITLKKIIFTNSSRILTNNTLGIFWP